jgi:hypothetical protein
MEQWIDELRRHGHKAWKVRLHGVVDVVILVVLVSSKFKILLQLGTGK